MANVLVRGLLTSVALLLVSIPALAAAGGYVARLPVVGGYGRLLNSDLPWLGAGAVGALVLAVLAIRLGGRRFTLLLALLCAAVVVSLLFVWWQFAGLAANERFSYDLVRQAQAPTPALRSPDERLVFAEVGGDELRAEVWHSRGPSAESGLTPGVLYVHGGAFTHGSPGIRPHLLATFADAGFAVADIEYRLAPPPRWQDAPADVVCALGWFQSVAPRYGVDPSRIVIVGDSAGGNLALVAAYTSATHDAGGSKASCDFPALPAAGVIANYPTADLSATWDDVRELSGETPFPEIYVGGPPSQYPDRYAAASVDHLIRADLPPTLILTGTNDLLVRVERMRDLADRLREAGSAVTLIEVPFADHGFDGYPNSFGAQLEEVVLPRFITEVTAK